MKAKDLSKMRIPAGPAMEAAIELCRGWTASGKDDRDLKPQLYKVVGEADAWTDDAVFGSLAKALVAHQGQCHFEERDEPAPYGVWGEGLESGALDQMKNAARLPVSVRGALMPDAHQGYGLPIGGVLAVKDAVIPYAVGVDIACRMKLSVLDLPVHMLEKKRDKLKKAIDAETRFGIGAHFKVRREHDVMDRDWSVTGVTRDMKDKAWSQLGSSGSGNHFVEFGVLTLAQADLGLEAGKYLALLSHSGSRGAGAAVAGHYSKVAKEKHPELPRVLQHLSWLDLDSAEGQEYWEAMSLMGHYASANHACVHRHMVEHLGAEVIAGVENHHNYAWKEQHDGQEVVVHRKGATPAGEGVLGVIPGSMADPGFVVRGKGNAASLSSAAHGAGRRMSRTAAKKKYTWKDASRVLKQRGVELMSAGLDELPMVYKNILEVMDQQQDLVEVVARFDPKLVKMAEAGERPED